MREVARAIAIRNAHPRLKLERARVRQAVALLDRHADQFEGGCPAGELSLVFLTDAALAQIHGDFMRDPSVTDVITFDGDPQAELAGEICVSADTAHRYVARSIAQPARRARAASAANPFSTELTLYLVHGWLHLAGYDDLEPAKKRRMRAAEKRAMDLLRSAKAVPHFQLR